MSGVLQQHTSHNERGAKIDIVANDDGLDGLAIHEAKRSENHGDTKCYETKATDGSDNIKAKEIGIFLLDFCKEFIELDLLIDG